MLMASPGLSSRVICRFALAEYKLRKSGETVVTSCVGRLKPVGTAVRTVGNAGAKALAPRQLAALRELHRWREAVGAELDRATFRIIGNDALLAVAKALPRAPAELGGIAALPRSLAARHGPALLEGVRRALALSEGELPRVERPPRQARDPAVDARVERLKAARNRAAAELGLDPGVLCGRSTLEAVARAQPPPNDRAGLARIGELRRWQIEAFGDALLAALG